MNFYLPNSPNTVVDMPVINTGSSIQKWFRNSDVINAIAGTELTADFLNAILLNIRNIAAEAQLDENVSIGDYFSNSVLNIIDTKITTFQDTLSETFATTEEVEALSETVDNLPDNSVGGIDNIAADVNFNGHKAVEMGDGVGDADGVTVSQLNVVKASIPTNTVDSDQLEAVANSIPTDTIDGDQLAAVANSIPTDTIDSDQLAAVANAIPTETVSQSDLSLAINGVGSTPLAIASNGVEYAVPNMTYLGDQVYLMITEYEYISNAGTFDGPNGVKKTLLLQHLTATNISALDTSNTFVAGSRFGASDWPQMVFWPLPSYAYYQTFHQNASGNSGRIYHLYTKV